MRSSTVPLDVLVNGLGAVVARPGERAALSLLVEHRTWLETPPMRNSIIEVTDTGPRFRWDRARRAAEHTAVDAEDGAVLAIAAGLAGYDMGIPLGHMLEGLRQQTAERVLDAMRIATGLESGVVLHLVEHRAVSRNPDLDDDF